MNTASKSDRREAGAVGEAVGIQTKDGALEAEAAVTPLTPEQLATMTPEEKDRWWFKNVYRGDKMPQLTVRAVLMGGILGMLMSAANLYTSLQIGWAFGIAITACVISFVMWTFVRFCSGNRVSQMSLLENACMASCASAAGYSTGSTIATMFGALVLLVEPPADVVTPGAREIWAQNLMTWDVTPVWVVTLFTFCTGMMGVFLAIPMKRQMINHEQLPFPSGTAAAETLRSLYSQSKEAVHKAYVLVAGLGAGLAIGFLRISEDVLNAVGFLRDLFASKFGLLRIPEDIKLHFADRFYPGLRHASGFSFEPSALLIAAGMIVGMRISLSMLLSSLVLYFGVGPWIAEQDAVHIERGAVVVMESVKKAGEGAKDVEEAGMLALQSIVQACEELGIESEPVRKAAEAGIGFTVEEIRKNKQAIDAKESIAAVLDSAGAAAAGVASTEYGNREATRAKNEARTKAIAEGKSEVEAEQLASAAFNAKKFKTSLIWNWGGGEIVLQRWALWGGTALMLCASLMSVALQWRTIARAFIGIRSGAADETSTAMAKIEVPGKWMVIGMMPITIVMIWLQIEAFSVSWYAGLIAVAMSFVLSLVACRATGETDTTPIGAMGKVMQLMFAGLAPANIGANLASAGIAANSASSSADLLTDLKTGYLLGANPRKQFLAQFFGVFFGTVAIIPIWYMMVPSRAKLETFALPSTRAWEAVARLLTQGVEALPSSALYAILIGSFIGIILPVIEVCLPAKFRRYMPSATGIGLAWLIPFQNSFSFFLGAMIALLWGVVHRRSRDKANVAMASGLVAGESLMAAALAIIATVLGLMKG